MKIGIFTDQYYPNISGVVTSINILAAGLRDLNHEVYIFTSYDDKLLDEDQRKNLAQKNVVNLPGRAYPFKKLKDYRYSIKRGKILKTIKGYNLDVIHVQTDFNISKIAISASKKFNIPVVHTLHTLYEDYLGYVSPFFDRHFHNLMFNFLGNLFIKPISKISVIDIVPTKKVLKLAPRYKMHGDIRVIPTGIDLSRFDSKLYSKQMILDLKSNLGIDDDKFVFAYIGRTSAEKSIEKIINAFSDLKNSENCVLLIVGGGPQLEELKELASQSEKSKQIIFTGFIPSVDIPRYYQVADVFVNASISETQGLTYVEALASSLPILVQKDDCLEDVVEDYYNGIYFDGVEDLTVKMDEVQKVKSTLKTIKSNTKKSVQKYSQEQYVKNIEAIYKEAIEKFKK